MWLDGLWGPESSWMECGGQRVVGWIVGAGEWLDELWGPESGWMNCGGQREVG